MSETTGDKAAAWTDANLSNPHAVSDKARRVEAMFAAIAPSYDINNRVHSLWRDQAWRRAAVRLANVRSTDVVLDVACGTGDLSMAFRDGGVMRVVGVDFTYNMLAVAQNKKSSTTGASLSYHAGDAMRLPIADGCMDVVSIAFGIRNVMDPVAALREFRRVLRPGGRLIILEFSLPTNAVLRGLYNLYFRHVLPRTASLIARDTSGAYKYLPQSVNTFIDRKRMVELMTQAGFTQPAVKPLTLGIAVLYRGLVAG